MFIIVATVAVKVETWISIFYNRNYESKLDNLFIIQYYTDVYRNYVGVGEASMLNWTLQDTVVTLFKLYVINYVYYFL